MKKIHLHIICLFFLGGTILAQDTIRLATWNTYLLPKVAKRTNQKDRAKEIGSFLLKQNLDVICLQEVFHKKSRGIIIDSLKDKYPHYIIVNNAGFLKTSSGLITFSKHPISSSIFKKYKDKIGVERFAKKGVLKTTISLSKDSLVVFNTHMQSTEKKKASVVRRKQLKEIRAFSKNDRQAVFLGDFNIRSKDLEDYPFMINTLQARDCKFTSILKTTCNVASNELNKNKEISKEQVLDYILLKDAYNRWRMVNKTVEEPRDLNKNVLSDHNYVQTQIIIK